MGGGLGGNWDETGEQEKKVKRGDEEVKRIERG